VAEQGTDSNLTIPPRTVVLLLAAGSGERLGLSMPKAFVHLAGRPMFDHSLDAMAGCPGIDSVVLVVPPEDQSLTMYAKKLVDARSGGPNIHAVIGGGTTRHASVWRGLSVLPDGVHAVVCHDAARPLASSQLFRRVLLRLEGADGVVPVVPSPDTPKRLVGGWVIETVPREEFALTQTPQAFVAASLREAHRVAGETGRVGTDDAMLLEAAGFRVAAVEGEASNFKVTSLDDLRRAEDLLARRGGRVR
jgi:2-C-methyl-D-erythritol 4-phosphate cytidylyltransferase